MNYWFVLNEKEFILNKEILPVIIHWKESTWASLFSILLVARLINLDYKVIYFCWFQAWKDELLKRIDQDKIQQINYKSDLNKLDLTKSILIKPWNKELLKYCLEKLWNTDEYILFVKNIDSCDFGTYKIFGNYGNTIISWDLDLCPFTQTIIKNNTNSKIYFQLPNFEDKIQLPTLDKYECYFHWEKEQWIIKVKFN